jgi:hypothetical protein
LLAVLHLNFLNFPKSSKKQASSNSLLLLEIFSFLRAAPRAFENSPEPISPLHKAANMFLMKNSLSKSRQGSAFESQLGLFLAFF